MQYLSTRGGVQLIPFTKAVIMGPAEDGGLLLPRTIPRIDSQTLSSWKELNYAELAFEVMSRFIDDIPVSDLKSLINRSYATFDIGDIVPIVHCGNIHVLELFHGPSLASKDIALQFLGNLFEYLLARSGEVLNILGSTSGDTGSAAIYGVRGKDRIRIFILHPHKRVSPVQEKQMTSIMDDNVFNIAIHGCFDDGQAIVKQIFSDIEFKTALNLGAINSINWATILAQVTYYVHSCLHVSIHENDGSLAFSVPTGNFGDIFAGYIAKQMLPEGCIRQLILATNSNDVLARFVNKGDYSRGQVFQTSTPSMDIQAASNFERYLFYLVDKEPQRVVRLMTEFANTGRIDLSAHIDQIHRDFAATAVSENEVLATIAKIYNEYDYILDPHTAIGVKAALNLKKSGIPIVCLATAHPAKSGAVVEKAIGRPPTFPESLTSILERKSRCEIMDADINNIRKYLRKNALYR